MELSNITIEVDTEDIISQLLPDCGYDRLLRQMDEDEVLEWVIDQVNMNDVFEPFDTDEIMDLLVNRHKYDGFDQFLSNIPTDEIVKYLIAHGYQCDVQNMNTETVNFNRVVNFLNHIMKMPTDDDLKCFTEMVKQLNPKVKFRLMQLLISIEVQNAD